MCCLHFVRGWRCFAAWWLPHVQGCPLSCWPHNAEAVSAHYDMPCFLPQHINCSATLIETPINIPHTTRSPAPTTCRKVAKFHGIPISCTGHKPLLLATVSGGWAAKGSEFFARMGAVLCPVHGLLPTSCPPFPACRVAASVPSFMPPAIPCCPCCAGVDAAGRTFVWVARRARKRVLQVRQLPLGCIEPRPAARAQPAWGIAASKHSACSWHTSHIPTPSSL